MDVNIIAVLVVVIIVILIGVLSRKRNKDKK